MIVVVGDGGPINITKNPQIAAGNNVGEELNLTGMDDTNIVTLDNGDGLLIDGSVDLDSKTILNLLWTGTLWREMSKSFV